MKALRSNTGGREKGLRKKKKEGGGGEGIRKWVNGGLWLMEVVLIVGVEVVVVVVVLVVHWRSSNR